MVDAAATSKPSPEVSDKAVQAAEVKAIDAQAKAVDATKSPEQRDAEKARADADTARAKAADDAASANAVPEAMTVAEAKIIAPVDPEMGAGDHLAQVFGNTPENPHIAKAEHADPELCTVKLSMIVPDHPLGVRTTIVHPEMVGDYLRAGWSTAD